MNRFEKFINRFWGSPKSKNPMPTRPLNLQLAPTPENAAKLAGLFVGVIKKNEQKQLDYSVGTLDFVDSFLQRFSDEGLDVNEFAETIFVAGAYVGQIMVQNSGGVWIRQQESRLPEGVTMSPIVIKLPNGNICDPIVKAFKRFHVGKAESLKHFYTVCCP
jgi:hypothetical protein